MKDWKPGVRPTSGSRAPNVQLRLSIAIAKLMKIDPAKLAKAMRTKELKPYAEKLYKALGDELNVEYGKAVKALK